MNSDKIQIIQHVSPTYKKCGLCGKVKDLPFKVLIYSASLINRLQSEIDTCRPCSENLAKLTGTPVPGEEVVKKFEFS